MGGVSTEGSNKLDVQLNLVPFIDLLSTLVLFLLITTVWMQVSALSASVDSKGQSANISTDQTKIMITVTRAGYKITWPAMYKTSNLPSVISTQKLGSLLQRLASKAPLPVVTVAGDDDTSYASVIEAIDTVKASGGSAVALNTN
ncbi:MAG: hypothetical protein A3K03_06740 [Bdellovibrionales bacterium RIFOXYD1_FULL_44_7]|nr:MAG: hypothetical protein A3K03_06740 [Bdellovibrionales bacterium RIFOXYD1_FULL_44_7]